MPKLKYCLAVLDFDNTLATFKDNKQQLFEIFKKIGLKEKNIQKAYANTWGKGFNFDSFLDEITKLTNKKIETTQIKKQMENWLKKNLILLDQGKFLLNQIKKTKIPFVISTFGNPEFQYKKIKTLKINPDVIVFHTDPPKINMLKNLVINFEKEIKAGQKIIFIDDAQKEIEAIKKSNANYAFDCIFLPRDKKKENFKTLQKLNFFPKSQHPKP